MSRRRLILFRLKDDESIWLADLDAGTVEQREPDEVEGLADVEMIGERVLKGLDFAIMATSREESASHYMFPSRGAS
jgi:hypothetical protein